MKAGFDTSVLFLLLLVEKTGAFCWTTTPADRKWKRHPFIGSALPLTLDDHDAKSCFGTREYWDDMYTGMGDFPQDEYSWYFGWESVKPCFPFPKESKILLPGVGNDPMLIDMFGNGFKDLTAFDYSEHAIERQRDLLSYHPSAASSVELHHMDARLLRADWTNKFDVILEKGALDAIFLSGDGNVEVAVAELTRVLKPGGHIVSISGVVPAELRNKIFEDWEWIRDGTDDLRAGCFLFRKPDETAMKEEYPREGVAQAVAVGA